MQNHRIVLTGGGTGGHIYPALSIAEQLREDPDVESILYVGARGHMEEKLAVDRGLHFIGLDVSGLPRNFSKKLISWPYQFIAAIFDARRSLLDFKPTAVLGTGGYASAPSLVAASLLSIPYAIHEPDAHPGLVNKLLSRGAKLVSCGMQGAYDKLRPSHGRIIVNGNPVGRNFLNPLKRDAASAVLGLRPDLKTILITGGSQGAKAINDNLIAILPELLALDPPIQIIHQVGSKNLYECKEKIDTLTLNNSRYFLRDYFDDLAIAYAASDLAICRAGAMTISELSVMGTPAIFIPYPFAAGDHQTHNATYMRDRNAASLVVQSELSPARFLQEIKSLVLDDEKLRNMRKMMISEGKPLAAKDLSVQLKEMSISHLIRKDKSKNNSVASI